MKYCRLTQFGIACSLMLLVGVLVGDDPDPDVTFEPLGSGSFRLDWTGEEDWSYFTQYSLDLQTNMVLSAHGVPRGRSRSHRSGTDL